MLIFVLIMSLELIIRDQEELSWSKVNREGESTMNLSDPLSSSPSLSLQLLGLDGSFRFLEHVVWLICLILAIIVAFGEYKIK